MVKIEALIQPVKLTEARAALEALEIREITISEVLHHGEASATRFYRGAGYRTAVPKIKIEILVSGERADEVTGALMRATRTRQSGDHDGRILIYEVADAIRIHNGLHVQHTFC